MLVPFIPVWKVKDKNESAIWFCPKIPSQIKVHNYYSYKCIPYHAVQLWKWKKNWSYLMVKCIFFACITR